MITAFPERSEPDEAGFSLVELLVVLSIIALVAAVAAYAPLIRKASPTAELRTHALRIATGLRVARAAAIRQGREIAFHFDAQKNAWASPSGSKVTHLPIGMTLKLDTARAAIRDATDAGLVFFHDGSSTGGRIGLSYGSGRMTINVAWINGAVSIDGLPP
jgi:general secretion pathway protein H